MNPDRATFGRFPWIISACLLLPGVALMCFAHDTLDLMPAIVAFLSLGLVLHGLQESAELRAFLLTFSACVMVAGLSEIWGTILTGSPENASDATLFYHVASTGFRLSLEETRRLIDAPYVVMFWRALYRAWDSLGLNFGPGLGVLLNSFVVALSGSLTTASARVLFGNDESRLALVGTLFSTCGLFWVFGATHLRDAYPLFLNVVLTYAFLRFLRAPGIMRLLAAALVFAGAFWAMAGIRLEYLPLLLIFTVFLLVSWATVHGSNPWRATLITALLGLMAGGLLVFKDAIFTWILNAALESTRYMDEYMNISQESGQATGLGYALIVNQPLPVRIIAGTAYMYLYPIPLWWGFNLSFAGDHWIRSYNGLFLTGLAPFGTYGMGVAIRKWADGGEDRPAWVFLLLFYLAGLMTVVLTTLEGRHLGPFLPAFLLFAALPDYRSPATWRRLRPILFLWYGGVVLIHLAWAFMKFRGG
jgi:hypothetical protein